MHVIVFLGGACREQCPRDCDPPLPHGFLLPLPLRHPQGGDATTHPGGRSGRAQHPGRPSRPSGSGREFNRIKISWAFFLVISKSILITFSNAGSAALNTVYTGILKNISLGWVLAIVLDYFDILLNCQPGVRGPRLDGLCGGAHGVARSRRLQEPRAIGAPAVLPGVPTRSQRQRPHPLRCPREVSKLSTVLGMAIDWV